MSRCGARFSVAPPVPWYRSFYPICRRHLLLSCVQDVSRSLSTSGAIATVVSAEVERRIERFRAALKRAGVKLTYQRLEIFRELARSLAHPDAEMIFQAVHARMPTMSLDTIYRTLSLLKDLGVVNPIGPRRESVRFDANLARHHHYVCLRCGLTRDFESPALNDLRLPGSLRSLGSVSTVQVEVRGFCRACGKKEVRGRAARGRTRDQRGKRA